MEPRRHRRGDVGDLIGEYFQEYASMEPRRHRRGDAASTLIPKVSPGFNGATTSPSWRFER